MRRFEGSFQGVGVLEASFKDSDPLKDPLKSLEGRQDIACVSMPSTRIGILARAEDAPHILRSYQRALAPPPSLPAT